MLALWLALVQVSVYAPRQAAAPHVARMESLDLDGRPEEGTIVFYRSGNLLREEKSSRFGSETTYADLDSNASLFVRRDAAGAIHSLNLSRSPPTLHRLPTGREERTLGESCVVSRYLWPDSGYDGEMCTTPDGILLWQATVASRPVSRTEIRLRAIAIERRPVARNELLPPRTLLAEALAAAPAAPPPKAADPDYEVELASAELGQVNRVLRRHGRFFSEVRQENARRELVLYNGAVLVAFAEDGAGRPLSLGINEGGFEEFVSPAARWAPVRGGPQEHLLGETCTWQVEVGIGASDVRFYQCRTADGIPLKIATWSDWTRTFRRSTAIRVSRRPLNDADFTLPPQAFDWAAWGITPAP